MYDSDSNRDHPNAKPRPHKHSLPIDYLAMLDLKYESEPRGGYTEIPHGPGETYFNIDAGPGPEPAPPPPPAGTRLLGGLIIPPFFSLARNMAAKEPPSPNQTGNFFGNLLSRLTSPARPVDAVTGTRPTPGEERRAFLDSYLADCMRKKSSTYTPEEKVQMKRIHEQLVREKEEERATEREKEEKERERRERKRRAKVRKGVERKKVDEEGCGDDDEEEDTTLNTCLSREHPLFGRMFREKVRIYTPSGTEVSVDSNGDVSIVDDVITADERRKLPTTDRGECSRAVMAQNRRLLQRLQIDQAREIELNRLIIEENRRTLRRLKSRRDRSDAVAVSDSVIHRDSTGKTRNQSPSKKRPAKMKAISTEMVLKKRKPERRLQEVETRECDDEDSVEPKKKETGARKEDRRCKDKTRECTEDSVEPKIKKETGARKDDRRRKVEISDYDSEEPLKGKEEGGARKDDRRRKAEKRECDDESVEFKIKEEVGTRKDDRRRKVETRECDDDSIEPLKVKDKAGTRKDDRRRKVEISDEDGVESKAKEEVGARKNDWRRKVEIRESDEESVEPKIKEETNARKDDRRRKVDTRQCAEDSLEPKIKEGSGARKDDTRRKVEIRECTTDSVEPVKVKDEAGARHKEKIIEDVVTRRKETKPEVKNVKKTKMPETRRLVTEYVTAGDDVQVMFHNKHFLEDRSAKKHSPKHIAPVFAASSDTGAGSSQPECAPRYLTPEVEKDVLSWIQNTLTPDISFSDCVIYHGTSSKDTVTPVLPKEERVVTRVPVSKEIKTKRGYRFADQGDSKDYIEAEEKANPRGVKKSTKTRTCERKARSPPEARHGNARRLANDVIRANDQGDIQAEEKTNTRCLKQGTKPRTCETEARSPPEARHGNARRLANDDTRANDQDDSKNGIEFEENTNPRGVKQGTKSRACETEPRRCHGEDARRLANDVTRANDRDDIEAKEKTNPRCVKQGTKPRAPKEDYHRYGGNARRVSNDVTRTKKEPYSTDDEGAWPHDFPPRRRCVNRRRKDPLRRHTGLTSSQESVVEADKQRSHAVRTRHVFPTNRRKDCDTGRRRDKVPISRRQVREYRRRYDAVRTKIGAWERVLKDTDREETGRDSVMEILEAISREEISSRGSTQTPADKARGFATEKATCLPRVGSRGRTRVVARRQPSFHRRSKHKNFRPRTNERRERTSVLIPESHRVVKRPMTPEELLSAPVEEVSSELVVKPTSREATREEPKVEEPIANETKEDTRAQLLEMLKKVHVKAEKLGRIRKLMEAIEERDDIGAGPKSDILSDMLLSVNIGGADVEEQVEEERKHDEVKGGKHKRTSSRPPVECPQQVVEVPVATIRHADNEKHDQSHVLFSKHVELPTPPSPTETNAIEKEQPQDIQRDVVKDVKISDEHFVQTARTPSSLHEDKPPPAVDEVVERMRKQHGGRHSRRSKLRASHEACVEQRVEDPVDGSAHRTEEGGDVTRLQQQQQQQQQQRDDDEEEMENRAKNASEETVVASGEETKLSADDVTSGGAISSSFNKVRSKQMEEHMAAVLTEYLAKKQQFQQFMEHEELIKQRRQTNYDEGQGNYDYASAQDFETRANNGEGREESIKQRRRTNYDGAQGNYEYACAEDAEDVIGGLSKKVDIVRHVTTTTTTCCCCCAHSVTDGLGRSDVTTHARREESELQQQRQRDGCRVVTDRANIASLSHKYVRPLEFEYGDEPKSCCDRRRVDVNAETFSKRENDVSDQFRSPPTDHFGQDSVISLMDPRRDNFRRSTNAVDGNYENDRFKPEMPSFVQQVAVDEPRQVDENGRMSREGLALGNREVNRSGDVIVDFSRRPDRVSTSECGMRTVDVTSSFERETGSSTINNNNNNNNNVGENTSRDVESHDDVIRCGRDDSCIDTPDKAMQEIFKKMDDVIINRFLTLASVNGITIVVTPRLVVNNESVRSSDDRFKDDGGSEEEKDVEDFRKDEFERVERREKVRSREKDEFERERVEKREKMRSREKDEFERERVEKWEKVRSREKDEFERERVEKSEKVRSREKDEFERERFEKMEEVRSLEKDEFERERVEKREVRSREKDEFERERVEKRERVRSQEETANVGEGFGTNNKAVVYKIMSVDDDGAEMLSPEVYRDEPEVAIRHRWAASERTLMDRIETVISNQERMQQLALRNNNNNNNTATKKNGVYVIGHVLCKSTGAIRRRENKMARARLRRCKTTRTRSKTWPACESPQGEPQQQQQQQDLRLLEEIALVGVTRDTPTAHAHNFDHCYEQVLRCLPVETTTTNDVTEKHRQVSSGEKTEKVIDKAASKTEKIIDKATSKTEKVIDKAASKTEKVIDKAASKTEKVIDKAASKTEKVIDKTASKTQKVIDKAASKTEKVIDKAASKTEKVIDKKVVVVDSFLERVRNNLDADELRMLDEASRTTLDITERRHNSNNNNNNNDDDDDASKELKVVYRSRTYEEASNSTSTGLNIRTIEEIIAEADNNNNNDRQLLSICECFGVDDIAGLMARLTSGDDAAMTMSRRLKMGERRTHRRRESRRHDDDEGKVCSNRSDNNSKGREETTTTTTTDNSPDDEGSKEVWRHRRLSKVVDIDEWIRDGAVATRGFTQQADNFVVPLQPKRSKKKKKTNDNNAAIGATCTPLSKFVLNYALKSGIILADVTATPTDDVTDCLNVKIELGDDKETLIVIRVPDEVEVASRSQVVHSSAQIVHVDSEEIVLSTETPEAVRWSRAEQEAFREALKSHPPSPRVWDRIASSVGRSKRDCVLHFMRIWRRLEGTQADQQ